MVSARCQAAHNRHYVSLVTPNQPNISAVMCIGSVDLNKEMLTIHERYGELTDLGAKLTEIEGSECSGHPTIEMAVVALGRQIGLKAEESLDLSRRLAEIIVSPRCGFRSVEEREE